MSDNRGPCPKCGSETNDHLTCHTWSQSRPDGTRQWTACMGCSSALDIYCTADECDWDYTWGLNPLNPRAAFNESRRPPWLVGDWTG